MTRIAPVRWFLPALFALVIGCAGCKSPTPRYVYPPGTTTTAPAQRPALLAPAPAGAPRAATTTAAADKSSPFAPVLKAPAPSTPSGREPVAYQLRAGDALIITLRGVTTRGNEDSIEDIIDESGSINLPFIGLIPAAGKTTSELEQIIQKTYLDRQIYKYITVNILVPTRSYYVRGEVRAPGRFSLLSRVTVAQAIAAAGGFSEFADTGRIEVFRGKERIRVNIRDVEKRPERDVDLEPGDVIIVRRSFF